MSLLNFISSFPGMPFLPQLPQGLLSFLAIPQVSLHCLVYTSTINMMWPLFSQKKSYKLIYLREEKTLTQVHTLIYTNGKYRMFHLSPFPLLSVQALLQLLISHGPPDRGFSSYSKLLYPG